MAVSSTQTRTLAEMERLAKRGPRLDFVVDYTLSNRGNARFVKPHSFDTIVKVHFDFQPDRARLNAVVGEKDIQPDSAAGRKAIDLPGRNLRFDEIGAWLDKLDKLLLDAQMDSGKFGGQED